MDSLSPAPRPTHLLCVSAHEESAFRRRAASIAQAVAGRAGAELASFCFTNDARHQHHRLRAAVLGSTAAELAGALGRATPKEVGPSSAEPRLALMFTGQGSQYPGMGRELYRCEREFRRRFDEVAACFGRELGAHLQDLLLRGGADAAALAQTELTQPAVFAVDYAVGRLLLAWGLRPAYVLGHSVGELAAAAVAGALELPEAARIVRERGRLMQGLPARGGMAAVFAASETIEELLAPFQGRLFVGAYNGAHQVISGESGALDSLLQQLGPRGVAFRRLEVSHAFHTPLLRPILEPFGRAFDGLVPRPPRIPIISSVTGAVATGPLGADHWLRHVLEPVRFEQGIRCALDAGVRIFVEAGPDKVLASLSRGLLGTSAVAIPVLQRKGGDTANALRAVGDLYERGVTLDLEAVHAEGAAGSGRPTPYPLSPASLGRPLAPRRLGVSPCPDGAATATALAPASGSASARANPLFWTWAWRPAVTNAALPLSEGRVLVIGPARLRPHLVQALGPEAERWTLLVPAGGPGSDGADLADLVRQAIGAGDVAAVAYLLGGWAGREGVDPAWPEGAEGAARTFLSLTQALQATRSTLPPKLPLVVATRGGLATAEREGDAQPWQSPALVLAQALGFEEPWIDSRAIDVEPEADDAALLAAALEELAIAPCTERLAARRAGVRLERELVPAREAATEPLRISDGDTFLITGGGSGLGAEVALGLARRARVKLVLVGRRHLPPRETWGSGSFSAGDAERVAAVQTLEEAGAVVRYEAADVTDRAAMADLVQRARRELGPIRGVVHCAGAVDPHAVKLTSKTARSLDIVLGPKIRGTAVLDEVTRDEPLQLFVAFSSIAASSVHWAKGLADYGAANFYIDQYCHLRAARGARGRSVAINWSLWRGKGMGRELGIELVSRRSGLAPLDPTQALNSFFELLQRPDPVVHVFERIEGPAEIDAGSPAARGSAIAAAGRPPAVPQEVYRAVIEVVAEQTGLAAVDVDGRRSFRDLGVDSHAAVEALRKLEARLGRRLYPTLLFEFKTPEDLAAHLAASPPAAPRGPEPAPVGLGDPVPAAAPRPGTEAVAAVAIGCGPAAAPERAADGRDVAIIGMACRLPGADDAEAFWDLLVSGRTVVGEAPPERFPASSYFARGATDPHLSYSKWGAFITEPYAFDAMFFGVSPREAVCMDPQQRVFLEVAWHAMQRAGYARERPADLGVFVGAEANCYAEHFINYQRFEVIRRALARSGWWPELSARASTELLQILERELEPAEITSDVAAGNGLNQIAARVSHFLDAHGPSLVLNSACSSSLVALHYACEALRRGEVSMAVAGGVSLNIGTTSSVFLSRVQALSPTGECRPFDRRANGMALGEGAAALVLKTLARARADRDHIHAVIKGSSVSNDGHSSGITVPTAAGQAAAVRRAYEISGVEPAAVSYIECHGTATPLGDPIEVQGLALSIGASRDASSPCLIGSVKGAIGHMLGAAGVPSVMKVSLALERRILPPSVGYEDPSPHIDFGTRFAVAGGEARPWASAVPRRAGVNAFGFGGTNCHVVLEEHVPEPGPDPRRTGAELLVLYGRTPAALREVARRFGSALARHPDLDLASISRSAYRSQRPLAHLAAMAVLDRADLAAKLEALVAERRAEGLHLGRVNARRASRVVLLLGTEWLPSAEDAAALAMGSRRLAALAVPQGASRPEIGGPDRSLFPLYACARILLELGLVCDAVVGDGTAAQVAARLQADLGLLDRADSAAHELTPDRLAGRAEPTVVLGLGATPSMLSEPGLAGEAVLATAIPPGAARRWAMDLLAQVAARGAPQRMDRSAEDAVWHVPLCEYPFERTRYQAFDPAALRASADPGAATPSRRNGEDIPRRTP